MMNTLIIRHLPILGIILFSVASAASTPEPRALYKRWEAIKTPLAAPAEALGGYSAGCLLGAKPLPERGVGYQIMRPARSRNYGHPDLIELIEAAAKWNKKTAGSDLLIGDISRPRGGPTISGHVSHQTGLDVDIWYLQSRKKLSKKMRNSIHSPSVVHGDKLRNWKKSYANIIQQFGENPKVDRIFVNPTIKKMFCEKFPQEKSPWLAKLRPWWGHSDHFHVRLRCPEGDKRCETQDPINPNDLGCDEKELAWWFSQEAKDELAKRQDSIQSEDRPFPDLPKDCLALTNLASASK